MTLYVQAGFDLEVLVGKAGANLSFVLTETGGGGATGSVSLSSGTHFLSIDGTSITKPDGETALALAYTPFTTALKAALDAIGNATYAVSFSSSTERLTIAAAGGGVTSFAIATFSSVAQKVLGFTSNRSGALTYDGDRAPWYWIKASQGGLSDYFWDEEEDGELGEDLKAHDGTVFALAEDEVPTLFDAKVPLEPRAKLWNEFASATVPFTWQRLFRHARNVEPIALDYSDGSITRKFFIRLRQDGRLFKPVPRQTKNWWEYGDVELKARLLGKT
jgi:hypothetical protein